ncbi:MAG TPA: histidine kinase [Chitinophagaceae bacterium]
MLSLKLNIPKYHSKDLQIMVATMLPMSILMNSFLYGKLYWTNPEILIVTTLISFSILALAFLSYGAIAISLRERFPADAQLNKRLMIAIAVFVIMSAVIISLLLRSYEYFHLYDYRFSESDFLKVFGAFVTMNVFLTFLNEGVSMFEKYQSTSRETELLKKEYTQSQLLGLKSQMNPHFLFNSLNTLSSLIHEDPEHAEEFLDEMSKVYRYLLKTNDEQLVSLHTELQFIKSYYYLLQSRMGDALSLNIEVQESKKELLLPPLTLQLLLENIVNNNCISKSEPLSITIAEDGDWLEIKNNVQPKVSGGCVEIDIAGIENISNKFLLLCQKKVELVQTATRNMIRIPLIQNEPELNLC